MNAEISETIGATILGLGMQIPEIPAQPTLTPTTRQNCGKLNIKTILTN